MTGHDAIFIACVFSSDIRKISFDEPSVVGDSAIRTGVPQRSSQSCTALTSAGTNKLNLVTPAPFSICLMAKDTDWLFQRCSEERFFDLSLTG